MPSPTRPMLTKALPTSHTIAVDGRTVTAPVPEPPWAPGRHECWYTVVAPGAVLPHERETIAAVLRKARADMPDLGWPSVSLVVAAWPDERPAGFAAIGPKTARGWVNCNDSRRLYVARRQSLPMIAMTLLHEARHLVQLKAVGRPLDAVDRVAMELDADEYAVAAMREMLAA